MNNDVILKVENLSKQYRLGTIGTGTISHDLNRFIAKIRGKEDPFLKIGESNDRASKGNSEYVWALKNINFEVKRGEVLGVIGKNGAGKSTLLKILSKVTGPSVGGIKSKGRIASLLEVGTGFHPEMTGKENIFLNGAILGMTKNEISSKLNEIVEFSGCERYIDTPVKRYSSGMKVRLAFAVAAFLEPDILVVDEVLSVGDVEFQRKAIGKMQEISNTNGRTVLFVSHDMVAVEKLCTRAILLENGEIVFESDSKSVINHYIKSNREKIDNIFFNDSVSEDFFLSKFEANPAAIVIGNDLTFSIKFINTSVVEKKVDIDIYDESRIKVSHLSTKYLNQIFFIDKGENEISCIIPNISLSPNDYYINILISDSSQQIYHKQEIIRFTILEGDYYNTGKIPKIGEAKFLMKYNWEQLTNERN